MPKVLRIINRFNLGGPTYNASYLTRYMAPEFETLLVGGKNDENEANSQYIPESLGLKPLIIPEMQRSISPSRDMKAYRKIKDLIRDFRPDIVHTHASKAGALGRRAAASLNVPVIVHTFHGHVFDAYFNGLKSSIYKRIERSLARKSSAIVALSEIQKHDLVSRHRICQEELVHIIPLGFDLSRFRENNGLKRIAFREKYGIREDEMAIGIVGRIVPIKNHALFLHALHYLLRHSSRKIRAFIVGDGESRAATEALARELGIDYSDATAEKRSTTLTFTSWLKDIDEVNAGMDIIALSSLNEGTPVSLIEAQASGKPIVTTRVGGIGNIVIPGETALLSDPHDAEEFGRHLLTLTEDETLRKSFAEKGWPFVESRFHYTRLVRDMRELYFRLLEDRR